MSTELVSAADPTAPAYDLMEAEERLLEHFGEADVMGLAKAYENGLHPGPAARQLPYRHADIILFGGRFCSRETAIEIAYELGSPMLLRTAILEDRAWAINDPDDFTTVFVYVRDHLLPREWRNRLIAEEAAAGPPF